MEFAPIPVSVTYITWGDALVSVFSSSCLVGYLMAVCRRSLWFCFWKESNVFRTSDQFLLRFFLNLLVERVHRSSREYKHSISSNIIYFCKSICTVFNVMKEFLIQDPLCLLVTIQQKWVRLGWWLELQHWAQWSDAATAWFYILHPSRVQQSLFFLLVCCF